MKLHLAGFLYGRTFSVFIKTVTQVTFLGICAYIALYLNWVEGVNR